MTRILETKDKTGRNIYLTQERLNHIQKHPEMADQIEQIKDTLKSPDIITKFPYDRKARFYYRYYKERNEHLLVLVKYLNGEGFIITSFYTDKVK